MPLTNRSLRVEVTITGNLTGGPGLNVWHYEGDPAVAVETAAADARDKLVTFYTAIADRFPSGTTIRVASKVVQIGVVPPVFVNVTATNVNGAGVGNELPSANAIVMGVLTAVATRRGRGRVFLSPSLISDTDTDGTPSTAAINDITTAGGALVSTPTPGTLPFFGVFSRLDVTIRPMTGVRVRDTFAVLRSRRD